MSKKLFAMVLLLAIAGTASAAIIPRGGITTTAHGSLGGVWNPQYLGDGSGLMSQLYIPITSRNAVHNGYSGRWQSTRGTGVGYSGTGTTGIGWLHFDFGAAYDIGEMWIWNGSQGSDGTFGGTRGFKDVVIQYSTDDTNWSSLWSGQLTRMTIQHLQPASQIITGLSGNARYVTMTVVSNWGDGTYLGFMEATFVPEPATICLLGLGGLALLRRKR